MKINDFLELPDVESVSGMDATFLYGETATSPMHIGGVAIIEGSLSFNRFRDTILSRIHMIPKLRKRLIEVPFGVDYPYWVDDPNFNIDMHLQHVALPKPGDWSQLRKMASSIFSEPLDKTRPLWSFTFVEGLDNVSQVEKGSVAIISKIHHVAIDGMAGAGILAILFDMSSEVKDLPPPKEYKPQKLPNEISMLMKSGLSFAKSPLKFPKLIKETVTATVKAGFVTRAQHLDLPTSPFTAPKTSLNTIISAKRNWNTSILDLDRVKALKKIIDCTLNDVILAICSGALRKYFLSKNKLPSKPLVAMVPISTRSKAEANQSGNQLSAMLIQLATNIEDPVERLETIHQNTIRGKSYQGAVGAKALSNIAEAVPFGVANQAARFYSRFNLSKMHRPVFNLVITNVPGPTIPIYLAGHKLNSIMGMAPIIDGMGLIITVLSYNGKITISPTSDQNSMPDLNDFSKYILEAANELEEAVLNYDKSKKKKSKSASTAAKNKAASEVFFTQLKAFIKKNPGFIRPDSGIFQFFIKGETPVDYTLNFNKQPASVRKGRAKNFDVGLTIQDKHLVKIANGSLGFAAAMIQGRISITGDFDKARKLGAILMKIQKEI